MRYSTSYPQLMFPAFVGHLFPVRKGNLLVLCLSSHLPFSLFMRKTRTSQPAIRPFPSWYISAPVSETSRFSLEEKMPFLGIKDRLKYFLLNNPLPSLNSSLSRQNWRGFV